MRPAIEPVCVIFSSFDINITDIDCALLGLPPLKIICYPLKETCEYNLTHQLSICSDSLLKSSWPVMQLSQAVNLAMVADSEDATSFNRH